MSLSAPHQDASASQGPLARLWRLERQVDWTRADTAAMVWLLSKRGLDDRYLSARLVGWKFFAAIVLSGQLLIELLPPPWILLGLWGVIAAPIGLMLAWHVERRALAASKAVLIGVGQAWRARGEASEGLAPGALDGASLSSGSENGAHAASLALDLSAGKEAGKAPRPRDLLCLDLMGPLAMRFARGADALAGMRAAEPAGAEGERLSLALFPRLCAQAERACLAEIGLDQEPPAAAARRL